MLSNCQGVGGNVRMGVCKVQYHSFTLQTLMYVEGTSLLVAKEIFCSPFQHSCFLFEFIWRIIIGNGGNATEKKNKTTESFVVFSDKRHLYAM